MKYVWVKGHSTNKVKTIQEDLNIIADMMATTYAKNPHPLHAPRQLPLSHPNYKIRLVHNNTTITSKLYKTLHTALHTKKLQQHIMKKHSLPPQAFNLIYWEAHEKSFTKLSRNQKNPYQQINSCTS
jgi:hypothetical protein